MKRFLSNISADRLTYRGFIFSLILLVLTVLFILINFSSLPPLLPVFNQLPWGEQRITGTLGIFIPVLVFAFVFVFNIILTSFVYSKNPLIARMLAATTLLVAIMNFLFIVRTIIVII